MRAHQSSTPDLLENTANTDLIPKAAERPLFADSQLGLQFYSTIHRKYFPGKASFVLVHPHKSTPGQDTEEDNCSSVRTDVGFLW